MPRPRPFKRLAGLAAGLVAAARDPAVRLRLGLTLGVIGGATVFYRHVEGWAWIDAAYFSTVTIATVGYGDFVPRTDAGKIFTMVYVIVGIGLFVAAGTAIADVLLEEARASRRAERQGRRRGGRGGEHGGGHGSDD